MKIGLIYDTREVCYGTLNYFLSQIQHALEKFGVTTKAITVFDNHVLMEKFDALIAMNSNLAALRMDDGSFGMDFFQCPFFNIFVDPPYQHNGTLTAHMENLYSIFLDEGHVEYCKQYFPPCKSVEMGYLIGPVGRQIPYEEREIDVLFTGGLYDFEGIRRSCLEKAPDDFMREFYEYLLEQGLQCPEKSMVEAVQCFLESYHCSITSKKQFNILMREMGVEAEYYLRGYYRQKVVQLLLEAGIRVHVAGKGWEGLAVKEEFRKNLIILDAMDMEKTGDVTANSKILLNVMPWFKDGIHDRIPTAMHNGAICVTDSSTYIDAKFQDMENIVMYRLEETDKLADKVKWLLAHPDRAKQIAEAGRQKAQTEYTWEKFVMDRILKWFW